MAKAKKIDFSGVLETPRSEAIAEFAHGLGYDDIPERVRERAKHLILDAVGIAYASTTFPFADSIVAGAKALAEGPGKHVLIGLADRLPLRDALLVNGALVHGLDYDDTHMKAVVHATATSFPAALGAAEAADAHGRDLLTAYVAGMEAVIRIGAAAQGGFHDKGYHPTGICAHFSTALIFGRLFGLTPEQLVTAQGIAGSTAAASQEFLQEGAWNKRIHPGWACVAGLTAARLAQNGFVAPSRPYEGPFGLFETHLQDLMHKVDYAAMTDGFHEMWETAEMAVKPYPTCHFTHSVADSALTLRDTHGVRAEDIERIRAMIPEPVIPIISEPILSKKKPRSDYEAKFSTQYIVATCFVRGRFTLAELDDSALKDPEILALADKVVCEPDPNSEFPAYFSGGLVVTLKDGSELVHHERVNRGAGDRQLTNDEIVAKFDDNAALALDPAAVERVRDAVLSLDTLSAADFAAALAKG